MKQIILLAASVALVWVWSKPKFNRWRQARHRSAASAGADVPTTKVCPRCFGKCMVQLPSLRLKICVDCQSETPWDLDQGQTYTLQPSRATRKVKPA